MFIFKLIFLFVYYLRIFDYYINIIKNRKLNCVFIYCKKERKRRWNMLEGWIEKEICVLFEFLNCECYEFFKNCVCCDFLMCILRFFGF